ASLNCFCKWSKSSCFFFKSSCLLRICVSLEPDESSCSKDASVWPFVTLSPCFAATAAILPAEEDFSVSRYAVSILPVPLIDDSRFPLRTAVVCTAACSGFCVCWRDHHPYPA